jgi:hypothetical protein
VVLVSKLLMIAAPSRSIQRKREAGSLTQSTEAAAHAGAAQK